MPTSRAQVWHEASLARLSITRRGQSERTTIALTQVDPIAEELADFARCVREGGQPEVSGDEGTRNIAVLEAIVESANTGRAADVAGR